MARPVQLVQLLSTDSIQSWQKAYSEIIDVRSENEFAEDHLPGAINLPVLNNEERAKVGTIYKQVSPFEARKLGAALVSKNISKHLSENFLNKDKNYSPLIYCWRGGQRSNSLALVLSQIGWNVHLLEGGYKTYRNYVREQLEQIPQTYNFKILCGLTGTGKTHILSKMVQEGFQILDLEQLANHRGSLLGQEWQNALEPQPSQKEFDSKVLFALQKLNPNLPVWVESESNKIGQVYLPSQLWKQMQQASCIEIQLPQSQRVELLLQEYAHFITHPELLKSKLNYLKPRYGKIKIEQWYQMIKMNQWQELVINLLENHYDPAYRRSMTKNFSGNKEVVFMSDLSSESVMEIIKKIAN